MKSTAQKCGEALKNTMFGCMVVATILSIVFYCIFISSRMTRLDRKTEILDYNWLTTPIERVAVKQNAVVDSLLESW